MNTYKIDWEYFFGGTTGKSFDRYYSAEVKGKRVEMHASNKGIEFSIGNFDQAKEHFKTEDQLIKALDE